MGLDDGNLAGWHRDPSGRHELRFWDGDAWTEHVVDEGIPGLDYPTRSGRRPEGGRSTPVPSIVPPAVPTATDQVAEPETPEAVEAPEPIVDPEPVVEPVVASEPQPVEETDPIVEPEPVVERGSVLEAVATSDPEPVAAEPEPDIEPEPVIDLVAESEADASAEESAAAPPVDDEAEPPMPAGLHTPLVASASVLAPAGGPSLRSGRHTDPPAQPAPPAPGPEPVNARTGTPPTPAPPTETLAADSPPIDTPRADITPAESQAPPVVNEPGEAPEPAAAGTPARGVPLRLIAEAPTVASPAGNSAGSNTSAIADPHRHAVSAPAPTAPDATGPRVTGASPVPVKRYRPGSPPASPLAGARALSAPPTEVVGTAVSPWYRRASAWLTILAVGVVAALVVVIVGMAADDTSPNRIGGRPPAAAPQGHKVIDGDGFGIAAPAGWIVATDPGDTFPQLRRKNWATPLAATDAKSGGAVLVVELHHLSHHPQVDPELFWTDQVKHASQPNTVTAGPPLSVHGFRANEITVAGPPGTPVVAASIDTGDRTFLVAVTGATAADAQTEFDRLIQTFDAR